MSLRNLLFCLAVALTIPGAVHSAPPPIVDTLRCEYRQNPLGIDALPPRLSWLMQSAERGQRQTAYQVLVASSPWNLAKGTGDLWNSGKVASDQSSLMSYAGVPLQSRMQCAWKVRIWDRRGRVSAWSKPALWTMGLLNPSDWQAKWIGVDQMADAPDKIDSVLIRRATWAAMDGAGLADVTAALQALVKDNHLEAKVSNEVLGGDPALNHRKRLHIEYELGGKRLTKDLAENDGLTLPEGYVDPADRTAIPRYLRKTFMIPHPVRKATVYATALGLYELHLNGQRVGDHLLAPEWTNYHKRVQYQTYDVTTLLRQGPNALGALLGNGWYCGHWQVWQSKLRSIYGDQPYLRMQLEIELMDGTRQVILSDGSWTGTTKGPLRCSGIYEGETYDARRDMPGWDTAKFSRVWRSAMVASPQTGQLVWQRSEPIRVTQELRPVSVSTPKPGVYVFDLGQNMAGWCRLRLHEPAGTTVTLQYNEMLNPDGTVYMDNLHAGHLSTGDRQIIRYTCRGGDQETYEPHFTYGGFRYVQVTGLTERPETGLITGRVFHTGFERAGSFTCSNPLLNRLAENIQWSQRANMMGVPTDCCQRDERCGYTGDGQFFMPTAVYNFDTAAFYNKWLVDICEDSQRPDGTFGDHAPDFGMGGDNVGWSDAGVICPYLFYRTYGDTRVIRDHYAAMKRNMEMLIRTGHGYTRGPDHVGNGDWLNLGGGASNEVIGTAYYAYDFRIMAEMARAIGETGDFEAYQHQADHINEAFLKSCVDSEGGIKNSSQTGYALAFTMGLVPENLKSKMSSQFALAVHHFNDHLATGFIGTPRLLPGLHAAGRDDIAYRLLLQQTFPSWLYQVKLGATTMWERWDGWTPEKGFQDSGMNSFNHYAFGSVGEYLFGMVGGIQAASPGYKTIRIQPVVQGGLTWASTSYDSIQGRIVSRWKHSGSTLTLDITIPANTTATVVVPTSSPSQVTESGKPAAQSVGVTFLRRENGSAVYQVGSGSYEFVTPFSLPAERAPAQTMISNPVP